MHNNLKTLKKIFILYMCVCLCMCVCVCRGWERGRVSKHKKGIRTLGHLSRRTENLGSHKNLLMHVYTNFIHDSQTLKTTQLPFNRWMVKQVMVHPCHGIPLSSKKEQTLDTCNNLEKSQRNYFEWKKSVSEVMYYVSRPMYNAFLKQQIREREFSGCQGSARQRAREMTTAMKVQDKRSSGRDNSRSWLWW